MFILPLTTQHLNRLPNKIECTSHHHKLARYFLSWSPSWPMVKASPVRYASPDLEPALSMYESENLTDHLLANMAATEVSSGACVHCPSSATAMLQGAEWAPCSNGHVELLCPSLWYNPRHRSQLGTLSLVHLSQRLCVLIHWSLNKAKLLKGVSWGGGGGQKCVEYINRYKLPVIK